MRSSIATVAIWITTSQAVFAADFHDGLARVDAGLRNNPSGVPAFARESCLNRRKYAVKLYRAKQLARAERSLRFCYDILEISATGPVPGLMARHVPPSVPKLEEIQARAAREVEQALALTPNIARGLEIYRSCAQCHSPEGWGLHSGSVPQLAGQHRKVVIKQLVDIRVGNRDGVLMLPYASADAIGGAQAVADVGGYIDTLEISVGNGKGSGKDLELGERLYGENCSRCHGSEGQGAPEKYVPRIQAQHYNYLVRQFEWIRDGKRRNANAEMVGQIKRFDARKTRAVLDYVSRLAPAADLQAPPHAQHPDLVDWGGV